MASVTLRNVSKVYPPSVQALQTTSLEVHDGEFLVLVGPSGCGKTTILRLISGLEELTTGDVFIGDRRVNPIAPKDRDVAMVFQNYALYPHMSVFENMAFGLKLRKVPKPQIRERVQDASKLLGLERLLNRKPKELSGGERQRVAMGRAIVRQPQVFLMDEPLSNLDAKLRSQMRVELQKLHHKLGTTTLYVTHDQIEAMTLGSRIVVMNQGVIQQIDTPINLYQKPRNLFVAGFIGTPPMNIFKIKVQARHPNLFLAGNGFELQVPDLKKEKLFTLDQREVFFGIRPEDLYEKKSKEGLLSLTGVVDAIEPMGSEVYLHLLVGQETLTARTSSQTKIKVGTSMEIFIDMDQMYAFDPETEKSIYYE